MVFLGKYSPFLVHGSPPLRTCRGGPRTGGFEDVPKGQKTKGKTRQGGQKNNPGVRGGHLLFTIQDGFAGFPRFLSP